MKKVALLFTGFIFLLWGCESETSVFIKPNPNASTRDQQNNCGAVNCNFSDINALDYNSICEFQDALLAQLNGCSITYDNPVCINPSGQPPSGFSTLKGFWVADVFNNSTLRNMFTSANIQLPSGVYCGDVDEADGYNPCEDEDPHQISIAANCDENMTPGWVSDSLDIANYASSIYDIACNYGKTISCAPGYVLKPVSIEFYIGTLSLCGNCIFIYCSESGYYYNANCSNTILFRVNYACCAT